MVLHALVLVGDLPIEFVDHVGAGASVPGKRASPLHHGKFILARF